MIILLVGVFFIASLKWGHWKHWEKYHSTMLYFILCDVLYNLLTYEYPLWSYMPHVLPNHLTANLLVDFIAFPSAVLLYLSNFPKRGLTKQIAYYLGWIALSVSIEWMYIYVFKMFTYDHGWNFSWSILLYFLLFIFLKLHHEKPIAAYALSLPVVLLFIVVFNIPFLSSR